MNSIVLGASREPLSRCTRIREVVQRLDTLRPVRQEVSKWLENLRDLRAQYALYESRTDVSLPEAPSGDRIAVHIEKVRSRLQGGPENVTAGQSYSHLKKAVEAVVQEYGRAIDEAWKDWRSGVVPQVHNDELTPYENDSIDKPIIARIRSLQQQLRGLTRPAKSAEEFAAVEGAAREIRTLLARLSLDAPAEVLEFRKAASGPPYASLDALTPTVLEWLREKNLIDRYRIRRG